MEYRYTLNIEEDTNDADYINETTELGVYDSESKEDMDFIKFVLLVLDCCELDDGYHTFELADIKRGIKKAKIDLQKIDKAIAKAYADQNDDDLKRALSDFIWKWEPHMDNCEYNHSLYYELTRIPANVAEEEVSIDINTMDLDFFTDDGEDEDEDDDESDYDDERR